jgi:hypothetical protein
MLMRRIAIATVEIKTRWDGFSTLFVVLARRNLDALTTTEKGWLKALS